MIQYFIIFILNILIAAPSTNQLSLDNKDLKTKEEYFDEGMAFLDFGNEKSAFNSTKKSAEMGHVGAQNNLGVMYGTGVGTDIDIEKSIYWIEKSAEGGSDMAQNTLGCMYKDALNGFKQDYSKANYWFEKAAEQGNYFAQYNLGLAYKWGNGVEIDYLTAISWLSKSWEQGYEDAKVEINEIFSWLEEYIGFPEGYLDSLKN